MIQNILGPVMAVGLMLTPSVAEARDANTPVGTAMLASAGARKSTPDNADRKLAPGVLVAVVVAAGAATYGYAKAVSARPDTRGD